MTSNTKKSFSLSLGGHFAIDARDKGAGLPPRLF